MPTLAGKGGSISIGGSNFAFRSWNAEFKTDPVDITSFSSGGYRENLDGLTSATISTRGPYLQGSMALTSGSSYALNLRVNTTVGFTCTARLTSIRIITEVDKAVEAEASFESTGSFTAAIT